MSAKFCASINIILPVVQVSMGQSERNRMDDTDDIAEQEQSQEQGEEQDTEAHSEVYNT